MSETTDLSGLWSGVYFYPIDPEWNANDNLPATPFTAELWDIDGDVSGTTLEPDLLGPSGAPPIPASVEGHRLDGTLTFTKFPCGGGQVHTIDYVGSISPDGNSVSGRWVIHGDWSGTFQMQRNTAPAAVSVDQSVSATP